MKVRNRKTGETREYKAPSLRTLEKDVWECVSRCVGPCKCRIEVDGECPRGWPSRVEVVLYSI